MWFFLMIMVTEIPNCYKEIFQLFDVLYKDCIQIPRPDLNSFYSTIKSAPLAVYISISSVFNAQDNSSGQNQTRTNPLIFPESLMEHYNFLQECLNFQHQNDFALALCLNACK